MQQAIIGEESTFDSQFFDTDGDPVDPNASATFKIFDQNKDLIASGTGIQDMGAPERWYTAVTIPSGAPSTEDPDDYYRIQWTLISRTGVQYTNTEQFRVYTHLDETAEPVEVIFHIEGDTEIEDMTVASAELTSMSVQLIDPFIPDRTLAKETVSSPTAFMHDSSNYIYRHVIDISALTLTGAGIEEFQVEWIKTYASGKQEREIHPCFIASRRALAYSSAVRLKVDKGQLWNLNLSLNIEDWNLIYCLNEAMRWINAANPQMTSWTLASLPDAMEMYLINYAAFEFLRMMYLAHGLSAFNFSGQSTQLEMDQTQYIQTVMDNLQSDLNEKIQSAKRNALRSTRRVGVGSVNFGPNSSITVYYGAANGMISNNILPYLFKAIV